MENLFDGLFGRVFRSGVKPLQIGRRLLQVVDSERSVDGQGRRVVPNSYLVQLSPDDRRDFEELEMSLLHELTIAVREYITQEGYHVKGKARVSLRTDPELKRGRFAVQARHTDTTSSGAPAPSDSPVSTVPSTNEPNKEQPLAVLSLSTGQEIELLEGRYILGRQLQSDIVLNDSNVSRQHAEIICSDGEVMIRDLGSTNGTKVNGVAVHSDQLLQQGDVIAIGGTQLRVDIS